MNSSGISKDKPSPYATTTTTTTIIGQIVKSFPLELRDARSPAAQLATFLEEIRQIISRWQSYKMSRIKRIYLCENIDKLG